MARHRDGHLLAIDLGHQSVALRIICPHVGRTFNYSDSPACRLQRENGKPGAGPYQADDCAIAEQVKDLDWEALEMGRDETVSPAALPIPVEWWADDEEFWLTPIVVDPPAITATCQACTTTLMWIDCPTGGWWAHDEHPGDGHDAIASRPDPAEEYNDAGQLVTTPQPIIALPPEPPVGAAVQGRTWVHLRSDDHASGVNWVAGVDLADALRQGGIVSRTWAEVLADGPVTVLPTPPRFQFPTLPLVLGFTGRNDPMTHAQVLTVSGLLRGAEQVHVGTDGSADAAVRMMLREARTHVIPHPNRDDDGDRNHDIVNSCEHLVAAPPAMFELKLSGTWDTIRYARQVGRPVTIVWPDGTTTTESGR